MNNIFITSLLTHARIPYALLLFLPLFILKAEILSEDTPWKATRNEIEILLDLFVLDKACDKIESELSSAKFASRSPTEKAFLHRSASVLYSQLRDFPKSENHFLIYLKIMDENPELQDEKYLELLSSPPVPYALSQEDLLKKAIKCALSKFPENIPTILESTNDWEFCPIRQIDGVLGKFSEKTDLRTEILTACADFYAQRDSFIEAANLLEKALSNAIEIHGGNSPKLIAPLLRNAVFYSVYVHDHERARDFVHRLLSIAKSPRSEEILDELWKERNAVFSLFQGNALDEESKAELAAVIEEICLKIQHDPFTDQEYGDFFVWIDGARNFPALNDESEKIIKRMVSEFGTAIPACVPDSLENLRKCIQICNSHFLSLDKTQQNACFKALIEKKQEIFGKNTISIVPEIIGLTDCSIDARNETSGYISSVSKGIRSKFGKSHPANIIYETMLLGYDERASEKIFIRIIEIAKKYYGEESIYTADEMICLANLYEYMEVTPLSLRALTKMAELSPSKTISEFLYDMTSYCPQPQTRMEELQTIREKISKIHEKHFGAKDIRTIPILRDICYDQMVAGSPDFDRSFERINSIMENEYSENKKEFLYYRFRLFDFFSLQYMPTKMGKVLQVLQETLNLIQSEFGENGRPFAAEYHLLMASIYSENGDLTNAEKQIDKAMEIFRTMPFFSSEEECEYVFSRISGSCPDSVRKLEEIKTFIKERREKYMR